LSITLNIGEKLHLSIKSKDRNKKFKMVSQVLDYHGEGIFVIAMPMTGGRLVPIQNNREIQIAYFRENGVYEFTAKVLERRGGTLPYLKIRALTPVQKSQRREYYRLGKVMPVTISIPAEGEEEVRKVKCLTLDISAGGMKVASNFGFQKDSILICELVLSNITLSVKARVIRSGEVYNEEYSFETSLQFIEVDERVRNEIITYIFEQQRDLKRKGLI
jgi:c-di-GMP-binding flagellar brake protein YcgR